MAKKEKNEMTVDQFYKREYSLLSQVVNFSCSHNTSPYVDSTLVKTPEAIYRGAPHSRNRFLSEEYLLNFRRSSMDISMGIGVGNYHSPGAIQSIACEELREDPRELTPLPPPRELKATLSGTIQKRRSFREFSGKPVDLKDLGTILHLAQGITGDAPLSGMPPTVSFKDYDKLYLRAAPSGGGLYPIHVYPIVINVKGLKEGVYKYIPFHHGLKAINPLPEDISPLAQFFDVKADQAGVLMLFIYELYGNSRKYGDSGMAFAFIEAGEIAAHMHLSATALNLGICDIGGYNKKACEDLVSADGITHHLIHLLVIGSK